MQLQQLQQQLVDAAKQDSVPPSASASIDDFLNDSPLGLANTADDVTPALGTVNTGEGDTDIARRESVPTAEVKSDPSPIAVQETSEPRTATSISAAPSPTPAKEELHGSTEDEPSHQSQSAGETAAVADADSGSIGSDVSAGKPSSVKLEDEGGDGKATSETTTVATSVDPAEKPLTENVRAWLAKYEAVERRERSLAEKLMVTHGNNVTQAKASANAQMANVAKHPSHRFSVVNFAPAAVLNLTW